MNSLPYVLEWEHTNCCKSELSLWSSTWLQRAIRVQSVKVVTAHTHGTGTSWPARGCINQVVNAHARGTVQLTKEDNQQRSRSCVSSSVTWIEESEAGSPRERALLLWPYFTTDSLNKTRKLKAHKNNRQTYATWILSLTGCCQPCMVYIPGYQPDDTPPSHWAWSSQEESQSQVNSLRWVGFWLIGEEPVVYVNKPVMM